MRGHAGPEGPSSAGFLATVTWLAVFSLLLVLAIVLVLVGAHQAGSAVWPLVVGTVPGREAAVAAVLGVLGTVLAVAGGGGRLGVARLWLAVLTALVLVDAVTSASARVVRMASAAGAQVVGADFGQLVLALTGPDAASPPSLARLLTGDELPPSPAFPSVLAQWRPDWSALAVCAALALIVAERHRRKLVVTPADHRGLVLLLGVITAGVLLAWSPLGTYARVAAAPFVVLVGMVVGPLGLVLTLTSAGACPRWLRTGAGVPALALLAAGGVILQDERVLVTLLLHPVALWTALAGLAVVAAWYWDAFRAAPVRGAAWMSWAAAAVLAAGCVLELALGQRAFGVDYFGVMQRLWAADALVDQRDATLPLAVLVVVTFGAASAVRRRRGRSTPRAVERPIAP